MDLHDVLPEVLVERLNLNLPAAARVRLRRLASASERREAELARELLLRALDEAERDQFFVELEAAATPALRAHLRALSGAVEKARGAKR